MTDFRALCAELLAALESWSPNGGAPLEEGAEAIAESRLINRARAALSQPEPEGPTDKELMKLLSKDLHKEFANWSRIYAEQAGIKPGVFRVVLNTLAVDFARGVLARYGRPAPQPVADGEVGELVDSLRHSGDALRAYGLHGGADVCARAADLLGRQHPQPIPDPQP